MITMLTSSTGFYKKDKDGKKTPDKFYRYNGFLDRLQKIWPLNAKVLIIAASPESYAKNDDVCELYKQVLEMSNLSAVSVDICDSRNVNIIDKLNAIDVIFLSGGHVPTQNAFFKQLCLKEKLKSFNGIVVAWSAGSMNCAETVYAGPELEGEALDPKYERWISGLGITKTNILPHFQSLRGECLDRMRLIEDIILLSVRTIIYLYKLGFANLSRFITNLLESVFYKFITIQWTYHFDKSVSSLCL